MAAYLSDTFFHFVGRRDPLDHAANYDKLAAILNSRSVRVPPDMPGSSIRRDPDGSAVQPLGKTTQARQRCLSARHTCARSPSAVRTGLLHLDIRIVAALVSRENECRPIAGRRTGPMHGSLLGWLSPFACALR